MTALLATPTILLWHIRDGKGWPEHSDFGSTHFMTHWPFITTSSIPNARIELIYHVEHLPESEISLDTIHALLTIFCNTNNFELSRHWQLLFQGSLLVWSLPAAFIPSFRLSQWHYSYKASVQAALYTSRGHCILLYLQTATAQPDARQPHPSLPWLPEKPKRQYCPSTRRKAKLPPRAQTWTPQLRHPPNTIFDARAVTLCRPPAKGTVISQNATKFLGAWWV